MRFQKRSFWKQNSIEFFSMQIRLFSSVGWEQRSMAFSPPSEIFAVASVPEEQLQTCSIRTEHQNSLCLTEADFSRAKAAQGRCPPLPEGQSDHDDGTGVGAVCSSLLRASGRSTRLHSAQCTWTPLLAERASPNGAAWIAGLAFVTWWEEINIRKPRQRSSVSRRPAG